MTAFTFTDKHGGETMVSIEGDAARISQDGGQVTLSDHSVRMLLPVFCNADRLLREVENMDPKTDHPAMLANVGRARGKMAAE